jgi:creatinine amidohydrolase/Fe(II)-dependent formamide hydrolase-like protein
VDVVRAIWDARERTRRDRAHGHATRARVETGDKIVAALIPRIVQVCKEMAGKE